MLGGNEVIIVIAVILLLFGSSQVPKLARNLGKAQKEFKDGLDQGKAETESTPDATPADATPADPDDKKTTTDS